MSRAPVNYPAELARLPGSPSVEGSARLPRGMMRGTVSSPPRLSKTNLPTPKVTDLEARMPQLQISALRIEGRD